MTLALLDGDIFAYRTAATAEQEEFWIAKSRVNEMLERCLSAVKAESYQLWLSGDPAENFRYQIYPEYKANRTQPRPRHLEPLREHLVTVWGARLTHGNETDDQLAMNQTKDTVICSIDKDLKQIPGKHWDFVKDIYEEISDEEGRIRFYKQLLIGDASDNIRGVTGIGKVKAGKLIIEGMSEKERFDLVRSKFNDDKRFMVVVDLIHLWRFEEDYFSKRPNIVEWMK